MLTKTKGIILRAVKHGETSLILSVFTEVSGLQSYMIKGVRNSKSRTKNGGLFQIGSLLDIVAEHKPNRQLQHIRSFEPAYIYQSLQEEIIKNSVAVFSVELLARLLPSEETMEALFQFVYDYFIALDQLPLSKIANFPLFFIIQCGRHFGYNITGHYSLSSPYLSIADGSFSADVPAPDKALLYEEDVKNLAAIINVQDMELVDTVRMNVETRNRLLDWYISFLQHHTQHLGNLRSLKIIREILH